MPGNGVLSFPVAPATTPYWRNCVASIDDHRSTEILPAQADIVIIGAGYAGASIAHHLIEQHRGRTLPSVVILEAREACSGATGRNGMVLLGHTFRCCFALLISSFRRPSQA
jgi:hypothetical protein